MVYKTGRKRTLEYVTEGQFNCLYSHILQGLPPPGDPNPTRTRGGVVELEIGLKHVGDTLCMFGLELQPAFSASDPFGEWYTSAPLPTPLLPQQYNVGVQTGGPATASPDIDISDVQWFAVPSPTPNNYSSSCTVEYKVTFKVDVEEYFEVIDLPPPTDPYGFPSYGGVPNQPWDGFAAFDGPKHRRIRWFEATEAEGMITAAASVSIVHDSGGSSTSVLAESPINVIIEIDDRKLSTVSTTFSSDSFAATHTASQKFNGLAIRSPAFQISGSNYLASFDPAFTLNATATAGNIEYESVGAIASVAPPIDHSYNVQLRQWADAFTGEHKIRLRTGGSDVFPVTQIVIANPSAAGTFQQFEGVGQLFRNRNTHLNYNFNTTGAVGCYLEDPFRQTESSPAWERRDAARDWRILWQGKAFDAGEIELADPLVLGDVGETDWSLENSASSGDPFAPLTPTRPDIPVVLTLTESSLADFRAYRFLRFSCIVRLSSTSEFEARLVVGGQTYAVDVPDGATVIEFDLCNPDDLAPAIQTRDSFWEPADSPMFGLEVESSVRLELYLESADEIEFSTWELFVGDSAALNLISSFEQWVETGGVKLKRFAWANVDGKLGLERADMSQTGELPFATFDWFSLAQLFSSLPQGWTWTPETVFPVDDYHKLSLDAISAGGNGAVLTGQINALQVAEHIEIDPRTVQVIQAQALWDSVICYPLIGNCWDDSPYPDVASATLRGLPLRARKYLRSTGWGLVIRSGGLMGGDEIDVYDDEADVSYPDTTDSLGRYTCSHPRGGAEHASRWQAFALSTLVDFQPRHWHRTSFTDAGRGAPDYAVSDSLQHVMGTVEAVTGGNKIALYFAGNSPQPLQWTRYQTEQVANPADSVSLAFGADGRLWLVFVVGTDVTLALAPVYTSVTVVATIGAGKKPRVEVSRSGLVYIYWIEGDKIRGQIRDQIGNIVQASFDAIQSDVDDVAFGVRCSPAAGGGWRMILLYTSGGSIIQATSPDGVNFS